jgi:leader peptidase (prepilin peptidase) / N-methyltransferase
MLCNKGYKLFRAGFSSMNGLELYTLYTIFVILFGLSIGSFLSVCIYRIPRAYSFYPEDHIPDEEVPDPVPFNTPVRSICPHCKEQLKWWHNIPVVSWFILGGKCAFCKTSISFRYPFVELFSAVLAYISFVQYGFTPTGVLIYLISAALLIVIFIDIDHYIIPDVISKNGIFLGIGITCLNYYTGILKVPFSQNLSELFWGLIIGGGFLYSIAKIYLWLRKKDGLGLGDVKLLFMIGAFFGPKGALTTVIIGSLLGSIIGIIILIISGLKLSHYIAFGPYLVMGCYLYIFLGDEALLALFDTVREVIGIVL